LRERDRIPVEAAVAWIDGATGRLGAEQVPLNQASGRVLGSDIYAVSPIPLVDCAAVDGFAMRAIETIGAGAYNPLVVSSTAVVAGAALPEAADAVAPFEQVESTDQGDVVLVEPVAAGANVDRQGAVAAAGALLTAAGTLLAPHHIGLLGVAGFSEVSSFRRPRVRLAFASAIQPCAAADGDGPMIRAAIKRDGGVILEAPLAEAMAGPDADIVLVIGGAETGRDDGSAGALAAAGTLDIRGVALIPGEKTGFGRTVAGVPVVLLPDPPAACWWSYELFAGRAIRRLGGRDFELPYRTQTVTIMRKIVSSIGMTEICPVRLRSEREIEPIPGFVESGLMAAVWADGFVVVPEASEGYPPGASITAYLYRER
jgi:molybdopterin molybdotransferase